MSIVPGPIMCVVGARPNFMKMAPLLLNERLFEDLQLPSPDINLEVGSGSHAVQTAEVMKRF